MAVRRAESLLELGRLDPAGIVARYLRWWREGAFDTGPVSGRAPEPMAAGMSPSEASAQVHQDFGGRTAGCNPAHRSPPLAMLASLADDDLSGCAVTEARFTHHDPLAGDVAAAVTPAISGPLSRHPHQLTESAPRKRPFCALSYRPQNQLQGGAPCWL
jgi:ADP-ribosylglycohydrolase